MKALKQTLKKYISYIFFSLSILCCFLIGMDAILELNLLWWPSKWAEKIYAIIAIIPCVWVLYNSINKPEKFFPEQKKDNK
jgi:hypothetical protein